MYDLLHLSKFDVALSKRAPRHHSNAENWPALHCVPVEVCRHLKPGAVGGRVTKASARNLSGPSWPDTIEIYHGLPQSLISLSRWQLRYITLAGVAIEWFPIHLAKRTHTIPILKSSWLAR